jgi:hypothetical protein
MKIPARRSIVTEAGSERGVALITTLLIMMLMSALLIGFTTVVMSDQRYRLIDRDRSKAFYGAESGIEKLTSDLGNLFFVTAAPTAAQLTALSTTPPVVPDVTFTTAGSGLAYGATYVGPSTATITTGPYAGLMALKKTYWLDSSVRTASNGESHLRRKIETVAIPVFQFGMFSDVDLSFHAGPNFNFGGRVHTNANLFLAEGGGATLTLPDKVTAVGQVVRQQLVNGVLITDSGHTGTVRVATAPGTYRNLLATEGSVAGGPASAANAAWPTISLSTYNGYIRSGLTGARVLNLPLLSSGGSNPDLVRRPPVNENVTNPELFQERLFGKASVRVLLSDIAADITNLPTVTANAPIQLDGNWLAAPPAGYGPVGAGLPPIARTPGAAGTEFLLTANVALGANVTITPAVALLPYYKLPAGASIQVTKGAAVYNETCTGTSGTPAVTNANWFTGCTPVAPAGGVATPATVSAVITTVDGNNILVSSPLAVAWAAGSGTIQVTNVAATPGTARFAPRTFWVHNNNNTVELVTCTGYTATTFTGCNVPANIVATVASPATATTAGLSNAGTGTIGGFLKVERQDANGVWADVTTEVLNFGFAGPNLGGSACADPTPNAILRIQRLRDNGGGVACTYAASQISSDYQPNALFDPREALYRDVAPASGVKLGGVMYYIALDVNNLTRWFAGAGVYAGGSGTTALNNAGYSVYFSDRRNNRNAANQETGQYGFEDIVNPASAAGTPNGALDTGEDVDASGAVDTYGQFPSYNGLANTEPPGALAPLTSLGATPARPTTDVRASQAQVNRSLLFRHALKLINGGLGQIPSPGFTVVSENPVYVQGDWNAAGGFTDIDGHKATAVMADAVTLLTSSWNDTTSFGINGVTGAAYNVANRNRTANSWYRLAIIGGKNVPFPRPGAGAPPQDFGTDGGAHNFLRMLEQGGTVNYRGSIATFFYSRQAIGVYKCCATVYGAPTRVFNFDIDFLDPAKLPPLTPMFRDLNALGFTEEIRPGQ